jgi:hypothetical protein
MQCSGVALGVGGTEVPAIGAVVTSQPELDLVGLAGREKEYPAPGAPRATLVKYSSGNAVAIRQMSQRSAPSE